VLLDARNVPDGTTLEADVCIIGGGPAGLTVARELAAPGRRTIVLESGGDEVEEGTQDLARGSCTAEPITDLLGATEVDMHLLRLRRLGGTANHWGGYCRPLEPAVFDERPWVDATGWPFGRAELDPYYDRAATALFLPDAEFDWEHWVDVLGLPRPLLDDEVMATRTFLKLAGSDVGAALQRMATGLADVTVLLHANVTSVVVDEPGGEHVERVQAASLEGGSFAVQATTYVLAAGGIESARLLLASDAVVPDGVGNQHDNVGRHFCEHLVAAMGFAVLTRPVEHAELYRLHDVATSPGYPAAAVKALITPTAEAAAEHELLDWEAQIDPGELPLNAPTQTGGLIDVPDVLPLVDGVEGRPGQTVHYVQVNGEQVPKRDSRVVLSDDRDELGSPLADLEWEISAQERSSMVAGARLFAARWAANGLGRVQLAPGGFDDEGERREHGELFVVFSLDPTQADLDGFPVGVGFHHMGTLRMSTRAEDGVTDADAKVHGVDNLYVAGSSLFPTSGASTPTFTIVALAIRLADHLKANVLR
jgi:choline dehydrogenase-like flavoprotein